MKNRNTEYTAVLVALAFALAPLVQAAPYPDGGPDSLPSPGTTGSTDDQTQVITIHSTGKVKRGKIGSFVLTMNRPATGTSAVTEAIMGGMYVNFKVSGTAVSGVDYLPLVSPVYIGQSGYGVILVHTLVDARSASIRQAYSVVVTLEPGPGYAIGTARSAKLMIEP
jgi:hypothetical protein